MRHSAAGVRSTLGGYLKKSVLFSSLRKKLAILALGTSAALTMGQINAQNIIYDSFSNGTGTVNIGGTTPNTSLPGSTWFGQSIAPDGANQPRVDYDTGVAYTYPYSSGSISIASTGSYVKPSLLTISADITINLLLGSAADRRGAGLGYFQSQPPGPGYPTDWFFRGFLVSPDGTLGLYTFGGNSVDLLHSVTAFDGFSVNDSYNLSFAIDTASGNITSVVFGGQDFTSEFSVYTGYFGDSVTNLAGFFGSSATESPGGIVDNFTVATVPEPSSLALALGAVFVLAVIAVRSRRVIAKV